jgi:NADH:ubiquinone oxidoreductase 24 kD subunit
MLRGAYDIWNAIKEKTGLEDGQTSEDGLFSIEEVECMGSCGTAPMMLVNEDYIENLTKEKALELIDSLK